MLPELGDPYHPKERGPEAVRNPNIARVCVVAWGIQAVICGTCFAATPTYEFRTLRNGVINDTVMNAVHPSCVATTRSGKWLLSFGDTGDGGPGNRVYFVESRDAGQTWSKPYKIIEPEHEKQGGGLSLFSLDDGRILGARLRIDHQDTSILNLKNERTSTITIVSSQDGGRTFAPVQRLRSPSESLVAGMNSLVKLGNGDLIFPAYCYPAIHTPRQPGEVYGSGFYRSTDGGKTWGDFELAFKEVPGTKAFSFNESAFAVKDDGTVVGFARIDSRPVRNMWKVRSQDNGKTWTMPEQTAIPGNFPEIKRLNNGLYLMVCGLRRERGRPTVLFISADGETFERAGTLYYSRPEYVGGRSWGGGTGGTQSIFPVGENRAYVVFYGGDLELRGKRCTYIDGCLVEARRSAPVGHASKATKPDLPSRPPSSPKIVNLPGGTTLELIYVAPGRMTNAAPVKDITLREGYYLGTCEVTQAQYEAVMGENPAHFRKDAHPVESVSWFDALAFCDALTRIERHAGRLSDREMYRLPTEAEWEFAARGGNKSQGFLYSGGRNIKEVAWKQGNSGYEPHDVGLKKANELGFCDMSGNVWEWTDDCYSDLPAYAGSGHYARQIAIRGGDCNSLAAYCHVDHRCAAAPAKPLRCLGFRVLRTISR